MAAGLRKPRTFVDSPAQNGYKKVRSKTKLDPFKLGAQEKFVSARIQFVRISYSKK